MSRPRLVCVVGPTASGKTALALELAEALDAEVVSADSRQVYRGLDIGTAKPSAQERAAAPYHGLDLVEPAERYSAGAFASDASIWIAAIAARGRLPVVVGGTGFYLRALFDGLFEEPRLEPERRRRLRGVLASLPGDVLNRWARRLDAAFRGGGRQRAARAVEMALLSGRPLSTLQATPVRATGLTAWYAVLALPRPVLAARIAERTRRMLDAGLIAEVRSLLAAGVATDAPGLTGVGYREAVAHLTGALPAAELPEAIAAATRQYAKRQETWFRHQLWGPVSRIDAAAEPDVLAREVLAGYRAAAS
jgi:tRNA dimethylallyltransferase